MDGPKTTTSPPEPAESQIPKDFFISYNQHDRVWAEWIAWTLEESGYTTVLQAWDNPTGAKIATFMNQATESTRRTIAVLSDDYLKSGYCMEEWEMRYHDDPSGRSRLLVPLRVRECKLPPIMRSRAYTDLFGLGEGDAKEALLRALGARAEVAAGRAPAAAGHLYKPADPPAFTGPAVADRPPSRWSPDPPPAEVLSPRDRLALAVELRSLPAEDFHALVAQLAPPADRVPGPPADQEVRIDRLLAWAEQGDGDGLARLRTALDVLEASPAAPRFRFEWRLVTLCLWLAVVGIAFLSLAYLVGSRTVQGTAHAYWDRRFVASGGDFAEGSTPYGVGTTAWLIEVFRMLILLFLALIATPADAFRDATRRLLSETALRRWFGDDDCPPPPGKPALDVRVAGAVFLVLGGALFAIVLLHHLTEPEKLWVFRGYKPATVPRPQPPPRLGDPLYWKTCLIPYLIYLPYSLINYLVGVNVLFTISAFAVVTDLVWMFQWTSAFRADCRRRKDSPTVLHLRFQVTFLGRLGEVLERYYFLLTCILIWAAFMVWFDRINLMPEAYQLEERALVVAPIPMLLLLLLSTVFYNAAREAAAARAADPDAFRRDHRLLAFYGRSLSHSKYLPVAGLVLVAIAGYLAAQGLGWFAPG